jgi:hypothetical protein
MTRLPLPARPGQPAPSPARRRRSGLGQGTYRGPCPGPGSALATPSPGPRCRADRRHAAAVRIWGTSFVDPRPATRGYARGLRALARRRRLAAARRGGSASPVRVRTTSVVEPEPAQPLPEEAEGLPDRGQRHERALRAAARRGRRGRGPQGREDRRGEQRGNEETGTLHGDSFAGGDLRRGRDGRRAPPRTNGTGRPVEKPATPS